MLVQLHRPPPPLDRFVELITFFSGYRPEHAREKIIPDGAIEIIVDLGERPKKLYRDERSAVAVDFRHAWISGMRTRPIVIEAQQHASLMIIRFRPGGAGPFLGFDPGGLTDVVAALDDVVGQAAASLRDRVLEAGGSADRMAAAQAWLTERGGRRPLSDPLIEHVLARIDSGASPGIGALAEEAGVSSRHLLDRFRARVGLGPKRYARVRRFQRLLAELARISGVPGIPALAGAALPAPDWARLAAGFGYVDQSHLVRDFRQFAETTPGRYVAAYRGLENYLPIFAP